MAPSQRMTLVAVPLLVVAALGLVIYLGRGPAQEPLLSGKIFSAEELKNAEAALRKGALLQYRVEGQQIFVPASDAARYNAALISNGGIPDAWGEELGKALDRNPFLVGSEKDRSEGMDVAKAKELVKMIKAIPFVEDAGLVWQRSKSRGGFSPESKMTATLGVRPRAGRDLTAEDVQSLRQFVAGAFGMAASDVTVTNLKTGKTPRPPDSNDPNNNGYVDAIRNFTALYQQNISEALAYIPNVLVTANVEVENMVQSQEQERKYDAKQFAYKTVEDTQTETSNETSPGSEPGVTANQPRAPRQQTSAKNTRSNEKSTSTIDSVPVGTRVTQRVIAGFTPKSVQIAVAIPKDYYHDVLVKRRVDESDKAGFEAKLAQVKLEEERAIREKVARLIPAPTGGSAADAVNVSSYDRLETSEPPAPVAMTTRIGELATQWGGPAALALFALWALWMLNRSTKRVPDAAAPAAGKPPAGKTAAAAAEPEQELPKEPTKRDRLQSLVKDNPEMAAAVLSRWLSPPK